MASGFVRGDTGFREVDLMDVLPPELKGFSTQEQQMKFAAGYEKQTGILVRYPWENDEQREARRAGFKAAPPPELGGDPVRLKRSLDRVIGEIHGLTRDNPQYDVILPQLIARANKFERALGLKETVFAGGVTVPAKATDAEPSKEALEKYEKFRALSPKDRRDSAKATKDREFLQLIKDRESDPVVVEAATLKLMALDPAATAVA
jgi:hypothetical protein